LFNYLPSPPSAPAVWAMSVVVTVACMAAVRAHRDCWFKSKLTASTLAMSFPVCLIGAQPRCLVVRRSVYSPARVNKLLAFPRANADHPVVP
jgi:hypothetical protein